jgi:hypothetical protein
LGAKQTTAKEMGAIFEEMMAIDREGKTPAPMFLMREDELSRVTKTVSVAEGKS